MGDVRAGPRRGFSWLVVGLAALIAVAAAVFWEVRPASDVPFGDTIAQPWPAPDFTLTDQLGRSQSLSGLRGKPVALTFVYTNCPDVCPLIATNLYATHLRLGDKARSVALVAVTVDPERDDVPQIRRFSDQRGLTDKWLFLTGSRSELEKVWSAYGIYAQEVDAQGRPVTPAPVAPAGSPETIEHSAPIYLIDKRGEVRALLPNSFTVDDLTADLEGLLAER